VCATISCSDGADERGHGQHDGHDEARMEDDPNAPAKAEDAAWEALVDSDDPGFESHDDEPRSVRLSDYGSATRPGTKVIVLVAATGWCAPCQAEASALNAFAKEYEPRGASVLTAVIENTDGDPADVEFARLWGRTFSLTVPIVVDSAFETRKYFDLDAMPSTMIIDADTLEIRTITVGADAGSDPLAKYRALVDFHLRKP
jgi:thiol-disulfide isomerase/thioredoxin